MTVILNQPTVHPIRDFRQDITHSTAVTPSVNTALATIEVPAGSTYKVTEILAGGTTDNRVDFEVVTRTSGSEVIVIKLTLFYPLQCMTGKIFSTPILASTPTGTPAGNTTLIRIRSKTATTGTHTASITAYEV